MEDDNDNQDQSEDITEWGSEDIKNALSGRDKKITTQEQELKELQEKLAAYESQQGDDADGNKDDDSSSNDGNGGSQEGLEDIPPAVLNLFKEMQSKIDSLQKSNIDQMLNVDEALKNEDFVKWADSTKTETWNPDSDTLGERYAEYYEKGNAKGMKHIMSLWNEHTSANDSSSVTVNHGSKVNSAARKKALDKAKELYEKSKIAMREKRFKDSLNLRNQAAALTREAG